MATPPEEPPNVPEALVELSGTVLEGRYELGRVLGAGGMGAVFVARHLRLDRPVAIKVLRPVFAGHDEYIQRFLREAKAASRIRHRNVVEILDYGEAAGGLVYSVMEFLVGQDLEQLLRAQPEGRLPWARACGLLVQVASGLKAAHGEGVIHRDIKPANCFLTHEDGEPLVKLVDFGIAKVDEADQTHQLTATAQVLGTPGYIAPELVRTNGHASPRSDIYSLGVLAYRMLTGRSPFKADTVFELLRRACFDPVPSLREQVPELPPAVEELVLELLAKAPDDRPEDMLAVRERMLVLSRNTLGAQAVEIPASSALSLDFEISSSPGSEDNTISLRDDAAYVNTVRSDSSAVGLTAVQLEPALDDLDQRISRPVRAPPAVMVAPPGAPQQPVQDPTSSPSRSGETIPALGEATLRIGDPASIVRPRRKGTLWLAFGGLGAVAGAIAVATTLRGGGGKEASFDRSAVTAATEAFDTEARVEAAASVTPQPDELAGPRPEPRRADATEEAADTAVASTEASTTGGPSLEVESDSLPPKEPSARAHPPDDVRVIAKSPVVVDRIKKPTSPAKAGNVSSIPPSDAFLIQELKGLIKTRCAKTLSGVTVAVSFVVSRDGEVLELTSNPRNAAGSCATAQVANTKFRPRFENEPKSFSVN